MLQLGPHTVASGSLILVSSYTMARDSNIFYKPDLILPGANSFHMLITTGACVAIVQRDGSVGWIQSLELNRRLPLSHLATALEAA